MEIEPFHSNRGHNKKRDRTWGWRETDGVVASVPKIAHCPPLKNMNVFFYLVWAGIVFPLRLCKEVLIGSASQGGSRQAW